MLVATQTRTAKVNGPTNADAWDAAQRFMQRVLESHSRDREQSFILKADWDALTDDQRATVTDFLSELDLTLYPSELNSEAALTTALSKRAGQPAKLLNVEGARTIASDDPRLPYGDVITFTVYDCKSDQEARQKVRAFLKALIETGVK